MAMQEYRSLKETNEQLKEQVRYVHFVGCRDLKFNSNWD